MQLALFLATVPLVLASVPDTVNDWHAPVDGDFRGPCPMMNTLANHGFLPRDGRNITKDNAIAALGNGINFDVELAGIMWEQAIIANPTPNSTFFTLDHLNQHNVLEHDASLSRSDAYFGNNHVFNQTIFDTSSRYWTSEALTAQQLANSKIFRMVESRADNPNYTFTTHTEAFSLGEVAAPFIVFGDMDLGVVNRTQVIYFFGEYLALPWVMSGEERNAKDTANLTMCHAENERLPTELGWSKKVDPVTLTQILATSELIANATSLFTEDITTSASNTTSSAARRRDLHAGF